MSMRAAISLLHIGGRAGSASRERRLGPVDAAARRVRRARASYRGGPGDVCRKMVEHFVIERKSAPPLLFAPTGCARRLRKRCRAQNFEIVS